jgi:coniferyl-aldehyde dehydrogenase
MDQDHEPSTSAQSSTQQDDLSQLLQRMRSAWQRQLPSYAQRMTDLERLASVVRARQDALCAAVSADFGRRSKHETLIADVMMVLEDIKHTRKKLRRWMADKRVSVDYKAWPARARIMYKPLGVVAVLAPWNYPIMLSLGPIAAAIAAGNHVILKPSEHTPKTSALLAELLAEVFPPERVSVVLGGPERAAAVTELPLDHLLFTGSTAIGRRVMAAAAKNLTPVTLELGGKSPCVIAPGFDVKRAAQRVLAMKLLNAGQTCIAPDYVLLPAQQIDAFVSACREEIQTAYPDLAQNLDYTSVVNTGQYARLQRYLDDAKTQGAELVSICPGAAPASGSQVLPPTLVLQTKPSMLLMQEEIFGPILPILGYQTLDEALRLVNENPRPLAFYLFDDARQRRHEVLQQITAGGVTVNDCALHITQHELPFGGVGPSGMGHYHGHAGFLTFSKQMPVFEQARWSSFWLLKPPYGKLADRMIGWLLK